MRPSNKSRSRNKPGNNGHSNGGSNLNNNPRRSMGNIVNRVFESAGPDGKVRGTPQQIIDKYQALARDAQVAGDRVAAENYLQHSEHYSRLLGEAQRSQGEPRFGQDREDPQPLIRSEEVQAIPRPQPAMMPPPMSSGLTTIEPEDSDDFGGPIETPENRRRLAESVAEQPMSVPAGDPAPLEPSLAQTEAVFAPEPVPVAQEQPVAEANPAEAAPAAPAKRPRVRRKAKVEPEPEPQPQPTIPDQPIEQL